MSRALPLRIAILTHSTNARGGVVHALELGDALTQLGHNVAVHAPDFSGEGFFRKTLAKAVSVSASAVTGDVAAMVETRVVDYVRHFERPGNRQFDIFHAQDSISGNALATLKSMHLIHSYVRTVHHLDHFSEPRLAHLQQRSFMEADHLFAVSQLWADQLALAFGRRPVVVGNGVDTRRFSPTSAPSDVVLRDRLGIRSGPVLLCVGGIEARKNTIAILEAFQQFHRLRPDAQLLIAGGASVLDHSGYHHQFQAALNSSGLPPRNVIRAGILPDSDMPALYRLSDVLVFASVREGFGLVALEAMASGLPVVASHIPPFTEYLSTTDVVWCDPLNVGSIANAMGIALAEPLRTRLSNNGLSVANRHDWRSTARAHLPVYAAVPTSQESQYA